MIKIGMVDQFLDNWHTNHYPELLDQAAALYGVEAKITCVWAEMDHPGGRRTTKQWCEDLGIPCAESYEDMLEKVDAVMVMCADDCYPHEALAQKALCCGKPVYCDKTFTSNLESAKRMFALADAHGTPVYTCSAKRYNAGVLESLKDRKEPVSFCATTGPGDIVNYSIHQYEMLQRAMGLGAKRCMGFTFGDVREVVYEYEDGRGASFLQAPTSPFTLQISDARSATVAPDVHEYEYMEFFRVMFEFFKTGVPPVSHADTLEIMAMQQAARQALAAPGQWVEVEKY